MDKARERYKQDIIYRLMVDSLADWLRSKYVTVKDLIEAINLAKILVIEDFAKGLEVKE